MKIVLTSMVKNEAGVITRMLDLCAPIIDEAVIIDTGSTDGTIETIEDWSVAHDIPITVHELPFEDFVTTKNKTLELAEATGADWILFMDADEHFLSGLQRLREIAEGDEWDAVAAWIIEGKPNEQIINKYPRLRMWRNNGLYRFVGPGVHETISPAGRIVGDQAIQIHHNHAHRTPESYQQRYRWYVEILNGWLKDHPDDLRAMFYLARTLREVGGTSLYESIDTFEKYLAKPENGYLDERWEAAYDLSLAWKSIGEYDKAMAACQRAIDIDPRRAETVGLMGVFYYQLNDWQTALKYFNQAASMPEPTDVMLFMDPRAYSVSPMNYASVCLDRLHQYRESLEMCRAILAKLPVPDARIAKNAGYLMQKTSLKWFFALGYTPEKVYGGMINDMGIGGVETTYMELPEHLAKLGHTCFVFCRCDEEHVYNGVNFVPYERLGQYSGITPDVLVTSRWFAPLDIPAGVKIIWLQDAWYAEPDRPDAWDKATLIVVSSPWHRQYVAERMGDRTPTGKIRVLPLGIRKSMFCRSIDRNPMQLVYSSNPNRGLFQLKEMWPEITRRNPGISLVITYGWEGLKTWSQDPAWIAQAEAQRDEIEAWSNESGNVFLSGRLPKQQLYDLLQSCGLCLYPGNFQETFCLTAVEVMAAGTPMITTHLGALPTTLDPSCNILIQGNPYGQKYQKEFIDKTTALLHDRNRMADWSRKCTTSILRNPHDWEDIAKAWEQVLFQVI